MTQLGLRAVLTSSPFANLCTDISRHRRIVTLPARMSIAGAQDIGLQAFPVACGPAITAQLIQPVAFLHFRGIVHSGW